MTVRGAFRIARDLVAFYWWEFRAGLGFERKIEHHNIDVSVCYKGVELIGCDSDHLYYVARLGGFADRGQGWVELLAPKEFQPGGGPGGDMAELYRLDQGAGIDPGDLSIRIRPAGAGHKCDGSCFCFATGACGPECSYCARVLGNIDVVDERKKP